MSRSPCSKSRRSKHWDSSCLRNASWTTQRHTFSTRHWKDHRQTTHSGAGGPVTSTTCSRDYRTGRQPMLPGTWNFKGTPTFSLLRWRMRTSPCPTSVVATDKASTTGITTYDLRPLRRPSRQPTRQPTLRPSSLFSLQPTTQALLRPSRQHSSRPTT